MNDLDSFLYLSLIVNSINFPVEARRLGDAVLTIKNKMKDIECLPDTSLLRIYIQIEFDCIEMTGRSTLNPRMNKKTKALSLYIILSQNDIAGIKGANYLETYVRDKLIYSLKSIADKYKYVNKGIEECIASLEKLYFTPAK